MYCIIIRVRPRPRARLAVQPSSYILCRYPRPPHGLSSASLKLLLDRHCIDGLFQLFDGMPNYWEKSLMCCSATTDYNPSHFPRPRRHDDEHDCSLVYRVNGLKLIHFWLTNFRDWMTLVFCCIAAWIQPDISGCQQDFLVVWRWNQLRTF